MSRKFWDSYDNNFWDWIIIGNSDNNGNSDDHLYSEPMPADLIDEIGPAPDNSNKPRNSANMVMDNIDDSVYANFLDQEIIADTYSSLQRGTSRVRQHTYSSSLFTLHCV